ncbi:MAG: hypothetical protein J2P36_39165 [Ktedonobacteraceae bacterium]|nr:hypothetical protein [Ktedonobacteraceae bacterium]
MADDAFRAGFFPEGVRAIAALGNQALLASRLSSASRQGAEKIIKKIPTVTSWKNGTGRLDSSFYVASSTPFEAAFQSDEPYAHRRDQGFSGTDSLGRTYNDEGAFYIDKAVNAAAPEVEDVYEKEINTAFGGF